MPSFFLLGGLPQVQETPTMKLHALLDWNCRALQTQLSLQKLSEKIL